MVLKQVKNWRLKRAGKICLFFAGGSGGNFIASLLADMYSIPLPVETTDANEFMCQGNTFISVHHMFQVWALDEPNPGDGHFEQFTAYPSRWKEWLELAKQNQTHFIIINSKDPCYSCNIGSIKASIREGWKYKMITRDMLESGDRDAKFNASWPKSWKRYKWAEQQYIKNNIPVTYFEFDELFLTDVKNSIKRLCDAFGPVNNIDKYVKIVQDYANKNQQLLTKYNNNVIVNFNKEPIAYSKRYPRIWTV